MGACKAPHCAPIWASLYFKAIYDVPLAYVGEQRIITLFSCPLYLLLHGCKECNNFQPKVIVWMHVEWFLAA